MFDDSWINGKCIVKDELIVFLGFFFLGIVIIVIEVILGSGYFYGVLLYVCCYGGYR